MLFDRGAATTGARGRRRAAGRTVPTRGRYPEEWAKAVVQRRTVRCAGLRDPQLRIRNLVGRGYVRRPCLAGSTK